MLKSIGPELALSVDEDAASEDGTMQVVTGLVMRLLMADCVSSDVYSKACHDMGARSSTTS
jgi:hypothetical protein